MYLQFKNKYNRNSIVYTEHFNVILHNKFTIHEAIKYET